MVSTLLYKAVISGRPWHRAWYTADSPLIPMWVVLRASGGQGFPVLYPSIEQEQGAQLEPAWWFIPVIPSLKRLRQEDHFELESSQGYLASTRPARA